VPTGVLAVLDYIFGLGVFGFLYWLLNGILLEFKPYSETGTVFDYASWLWFGALVIYLVFGAFWLPRKVKEFPPNMGGGSFR